jgi:hypothetical protein
MNKRLRGAESLFSELKTTGARRIVLISDFKPVGGTRPMRLSS